MAWFRSRQWSIEDVTPPWGARPSIHDFLRDNPDATELPDEPEDDGSIGWAAGALDGVMGHHGNPDASPDHIYTLLTDLLEQSDDARARAFYDAVCDGTVLDVIDPLFDRMAETADDLDGGRVLRLGRWLAENAADREAVKLGIALCGVLRGAPEEPCLRLLGAHDEFTLYAAVALASTAEDPEQAQFDVAQRVHGWGRIHIVERLAGTTRPDIQAWMLREGFRNEIMYAYLAVQCAETGRLHEALAPDDIDDALFDGACDLLASISESGPAADLRHYDHGADVAVRYLEHVAARPDAGLQHLVTTRDLLDFSKDQSDQVETWTDAHRARVWSLYQEITDRSTWEALVVAGLNQHDDHHLTWLATRGADVLGLDTWNVHVASVQQDPRSEPDWHRLSGQVDDGRIDELVALATTHLPLDEIGTGPAEEWGLGEPFVLHRCLEHVVRALERWPEKGWGLVTVALASPVVRSRNAAIGVMERLARDRWPGDLVSRVRAARDSETNTDLGIRMDELLGR